MVDFSAFSPEGNLPVYYQLLLYFKRCCVSGAVADGEELPSRRVLSALLGINPNTAQKIYRLLEEEGLIVSHAGAKSVVTLSPQRVERLREELLEADLRELIAAMRQMGITREEAGKLMEKYWEEG